MLPATDISGRQAGDAAGRNRLETRGWRGGGTDLTSGEDSDADIAKEGGGCPVQRHPGGSPERKTVSTPWGWQGEGQAYRVGG